MIFSQINTALVFFFFIRAHHNFKAFHQRPPKAFLMNTRFIKPDKFSFAVLEFSKQ